MGMWPLRAEVGTSASCRDTQVLRGTGRHSNRSTKGGAPIPRTHGCSLTPTHLPLLSVWLQDTHLLYVLAAANLYAQMHGLPGSQDQPALRKMLKLLPLPGPQHLASTFPNDLASTELGEVPLPPYAATQSLTLPSACAIEGGGCLGACSKLIISQAL